jgi:hypothetical protein
MESVFANPAEVKQLLEKGMRDKLEGGELDQLEFEQMEEGLRTPPKQPSPGNAFVQLRGEGGSGELGRGAMRIGDEVRKTGDEGSWELGEEVGEQGDWQESREDGDSSAITSLSDQLAAMKKDISDLKLFVDDQARSLNTIIAPLQSRIQQLEAKLAVSVPVAQVGSMHRRQSSTPQVGSPTRMATKSGIGIPRFGSPGPVASMATIEAFLSKNRNYPSLKSVREAKLNQLQVEQGFTPQTLQVGVADWNANRLYRLICEAHGQA